MFFKWNSLPLKGYKVTDTGRNKKYGIAANSIDMLRKKSSEKFNITNSELYLAEDGAKVVDNEYFLTLPAQTLFIIANKKDEVKSDFEIFKNNWRKINHDILNTGDVIINFIKSNSKDFGEFIAEAQKKNLEKTLLSKRADHEDWFQGQDSKYMLKEDVLKRKAQDRIRGYYYKVKEDLIKSTIYRNNQYAKQKIDFLLKLFHQFLIGVNYFECLFDRTYRNKHKSVRENYIDNIDGASPKKRVKETIKKYIKDEEIFKKNCVSLCTKDGLFKCHGLWNQNKCKYDNHSINPYSCRESLILFQIWNLDHQIELSRTIIASILQQVEKLTKNDTLCVKHNKMNTNLSVLTYFYELFTVNNLKLVHIICHDKTIHNLKSNGNIICKKCDEYVILNDFNIKFNESL